MKHFNFLKRAIGVSALVFLTSASFAQSNVYDDVIATSPNHTYLSAALQQEGLDVVLQDPNATYTVFAPDDAAFTNLATALNTNIAGLLALPNLSDILTYHVLGTTVPSSGVTNGAIVQPLSMTNSLKLTVTGNSDVYVNQAQVTAVDLATDNGVVHVLNAVVLPSETVVDVAIDNNFTSLTAAVIEAELLPALTDPLAELTVFAPDDNAFDNLATALNTNIAGLLALPNLADILTYHVLGSEVPASGVTNGLIAQPLSTTNTLKLTVTGNSEVYVNQAQVTATDIMADNGVVHILNAVVLPSETVVDIAIDNSFTSLTAAVIEAELLPALTDPLAQLTVFAPDDNAFDDLAAALNTDINGLLALPNLGDILTYHVVSDSYMAADLTDGPLAALNGSDLQIDTQNGATVNGTNITLTDLMADNGIVHVVEDVLLESTTGISDNSELELTVYPNPTTAYLTIEMPNEDIASLSIVDLQGREVKTASLMNGVTTIDVSDIATGNYIVVVVTDQLRTIKKLQVVSSK